MVKSPPTDCTNLFRYSVVIPAYNSATTIEATIGSVLHQSLLPMQIIVVDDGSTDATADIVRSLNSRSIELVKQSNAGPGVARNRGIHAARFDWIAFVDSDDLWSVDHAATLGELGSAFPAADILATKHRELNGRAAEIGPTEAIASSLIDFFSTSDLTPFCASAVAVRRQFLHQVGGFAAAFPGEDIDLWFRSALIGSIAMTNRVTAFYVRRPTSLMGQTNTLLRHMDRQPVLESIGKALRDPLCAGRREAVLQYRKKFYSHFLRQAIVQAESQIARKIYRTMREGSMRVPFYLMLLSLLPPALLRSANTVRRALLRGPTNV